jgi:hypothetical protein
MSIVSLVIAPTLAHNFENKINIERQQKIESLNNMEKASASTDVNLNQWTLITPPGTDNSIAAKEVDTFVDVLKQDRLIGKKTFSIAVAEGILYINGDKQPEEINNKYSKYITGSGDFISKESKE